MVKELHGVKYDEAYPWRPKYYWDHCPKCFEVFDLNFKCDNCGSGIGSIFGDPVKEQTEE